MGVRYNSVVRIHENTKKRLKKYLETYRTSEGFSVEQAQFLDWSVNVMIDDLESSDNKTEESANQ